jgi:hypothetical protein
VKREVVVEVVVGEERLECDAAVQGRRKRTGRRIKMDTPAAHVSAKDVPVFRHRSCAAPCSPLDLPKD